MVACGYLVGIVRELFHVSGGRKPGRRGSKTKKLGTRQKSDKRLL